MRWLAVVAAVIASPAAGQVAVPRPISPATVASKSEVQAAADAAAAARAVAEAACHPMAAIPPAETISGSAGSGNDCRLVNAVQPRITRAVLATTATGGTATVTWAALPAVPVVIPVPLVAANAGQAPLCFPMAGTVTTSGATVKCFTTQAVIVTALGATVAPITTAAAGVQVQVFAVPTTP